MNNLYYTEKETMSLFGYKTSSSLKRFRNNETAKKISNRWYYIRDVIDALFEKLDAEMCLVTRKVYESFTEIEINFNEYLCLKDALNVVSISRQRLYQLKDEGKIKIIKYDGFFWFCKTDLQNHIKKESVISAGK